MRRASDIGREFMDDGFEFLVDPSSESVGNAAGRRGNRAGIPGCFVYLGRYVKVAEFNSYI